MKNFILFIAFLSLNLQSTFSQPEPSQHLEEFVNKKMTKRGILLGSGHQLKAKSYEAPKKIGILVFGVTTAKEYTGNDGYFDYFQSMSQDGATMVAQAIHDASIKAIKSSYKEQGVELYTPDEYLDSDAKRQAYQNMDMRIMGAARMMGGIATPEKIGLPQGYKYFTNSWYHNDIGGRADIADELKMFGMDGYLSIFVEFYGPTTLYQIRTNLIVFKDRDYQSRIKKETYRRTDISNNMLPIGTTQIEASARNELKAMRKNGREDMVSFENGVLWIDPNIAKVIEYSANLYFPMVK